MAVVGYWLVIDGFPRALGTKDLPTVTTYYPTDEAPVGLSHTPGRLAWPTGSIDEQIEPVTGALRAGSMTFTLVDDPADPVLDQYLSLDPRRITTATVASSITSTSTSITLNATVPSSITGLSYPAVVWIDEEAILCSGYAANVLTVTTRGYYGTRASAHRVDTELGQYPEVWGTFPFGVGRRVVLYAVDDSDLASATAVWRGYLRAPRLAREGAAYELPCEHLSTWEMQRPAGGLTYTTRLRGFNTRACHFRFHIPESYGGQDGEGFVSSWHVWASGGFDGPYGSTWAHLDDFLQWSRDTLATRLAGTQINGAGPSKGAQGAVSVRIDRVGNTVTFECGSNATGATILTWQPSVSIRMFGQVTEAAAPSRTSNIHRGSIVMQFPQVALRTTTISPRALPVERLDGLPTTFDGATTYGDGIFATRIRPVLSAPYDDSTRLLLLPESSSTNDATVGGGPAITCTGRYISSRGGGAVASGLQRKLLVDAGYSEAGYAIRRDIGNTESWIDKPLKLAYTQWVTTDHWIYGIKRALQDANVSTGSDSRNWDWAEASAVAELTAGDLSSREWFLDGTRTIKDLLGDTLTLDGCALSTGPYGRLKIVPVQPSRQHWGTTDFAQEIDCVPSSTRTNIVNGCKPGWSTLADALTNVVTLATDTVEGVTVQDVRSFQRYGQRSKLELKVDGVPLDRRSGEDPRAIAQRLLQRITGIWSEPVFQVTLTIPAVDKSGNALWYGDTTRALYPGRFVVLRNAFNVPDGTGSRSLDLRGVFVAGRRVNLSNNTIDLTLWLLRECYAYTPAVKAYSVVALTGVVTAATGYVRKDHMDATDYAGGELGVGGVAGFEAGDKVRLITRDSTSPVQETYTVGSVDSVAGTITMTTAIATAPYNWPTLASGGWVDVIPATFTTTPNQTYHAWVGDGTAAEGVIGASSTQSREFAP